MGKTSNLAVLSNTFDVNSAGAVSIGGSTGTSGQVLTSQGAGAPPQWSGNSFNGTTTQTIGTLTSGAHVRLGSFTVTGAQLGDFVSVSASINLFGVNLFGYVSAADSVQLCWENNSGSSVTLGAATYYIRCTRP